MMSTSAGQPRFAALIPAKPPHLGKQRLNAVPAAFRSALATAFALDTLVAVQRCEVVASAWLVSADASLAAAAERLGIPTIVDPGGPAGDFNAMLQEVVAGLPIDADTPVVVVPADLPALTGADLGEVLRVWNGSGPAFVADAHGSGTTLYVATVTDFAPRYGVGSREAHLTGGAIELPVWLGSVQQDVDDVRDLDAAVSLGVGPNTRAVLSRLGLGRR